MCPLDKHDSFTNFSNSLQKFTKSTAADTAPTPQLMLQSFKKLQKAFFASGPVKEPKKCELQNALAAHHFIQLMYFKPNEI